MNVTTRAVLCVTHFHPGQRRAVGMPFSACSMCRPHPAQVINPHLLHAEEVQVSATVR